MSIYRTEDLPDDTQFCILMTDWCEPEEVYKPRQNCPDFNWGHTDVNYPATRPYNETSLCNSKITATRWPRAWVQWYLDLNDHNLKYACDIANGIINNVSGQVQLEPPYDLDDYDEMPKFENLSHAGSIHIVEEADKNGVRIRAWNYSDTPDYSLTFRNSVMISKFTGIVPLGVGTPPNTDISKYTNLYDPGDDVYLPVCVQDGKGAWIDAHEVELFPLLGWVTIGNRDLIVRDGPGVQYNHVETWKAGNAVLIDRYHPSGYDVWGRTYKGWIPLRYQPYFGRQDYIEPTSWHLESAPGLKPYTHSIAGEYDYVSPYADEGIPPEEEMLYQVEVIWSALNVRVGPGLTYAVDHAVTKGTILDVYQEQFNPADGINWLQVKHDNLTGWCSGSSKYVQKIEPPEPPPSGDYEQGWNDAIDAAIAALQALRIK
jgi:uncharacterized protein YraI